AKFATVLRFLQPMTDLLRVGFKLYAIRMSQFNSAMSYNYHNAITGTYPDYAIDYTRALISRGHLEGAADPQVHASGGASLELGWDDNVGVGNAKETDQTLVVIYNPEKGEAVTVVKAATRLDFPQDISVPSHFVGDEVEVFLGFVSEDGKEISNSSYVGSVTVT
ncbi:DUF6266 family protein, partial [Bacteroidales bacterium OttesenSCG-928-B11]|nr:DUF6266 family protein [Bacteroidales bacterium OttesenSCG-928-B11]